MMFIYSFFRFTQTCLELASGENGAAFLSVPWHKEAFYRLGVQDVTEFGLIDALCSACWEKKKKKEREECAGGFFPMASNVSLAVLCRILTAALCN
jgi:hypothetical protein